MKFNSKKLQIFMVLLIILFIISIYPKNVFGIGLSPSKTVYEFKPGMDIDLDIVLLSNMGTITEVKLTPEVDPNYCCALNAEEDSKILDSVKITPYSVFDMSPGEAKKVHVHIDLPEKFENPGTHVILIRAQEHPKESSGMIGAVSAVRSVIKINVPYPGKYIEYTPNIKHPSIGEKARISMDMINRGDELINELNVKIVVLNSEFAEETPENIIGTYTKTINDIDPLEKVNVVWDFDSTKLKGGTYKVIFHLDYDGSSSTKEKILKVGTKDVDLKDYDKLINLYGVDVSKFNIELENKWNDKLSNVYGEITFLDLNNTKIATIKTTPDSLNAWQIKNFNGYLELNRFKVGDYTAKIKVYFDGNTSEFKVPVKFINEEPTEEKENTKSNFKIELSLTAKIIIGAVILIILIILFNVFLLKKLTEKIE